jgi:hypothetical protein
MCMLVSIHITPHTWVCIYLNVDFSSQEPSDQPEDPVETALRRQTDLRVEMQGGSGQQPGPSTDI